MWIEPAGFAEIHTRGATEGHRLQDPSKWVPLGVGPIEGRQAPPALGGGEAGAPSGSGTDDGTGGD